MQYQLMLNFSSEKQWKVVAKKANEVMVQGRFRRTLRPVFLNLCETVAG